MSYKLENTATEQERLNFIVKYNHNQGLKIESGLNGELYALLQDEIMQDGMPITNPLYEQEQALLRKKYFEAEFFKTSLGYIRRKVTMQGGSTKDFLADLLPSVKLGLELGQVVNIITYSEPDFAQELTSDYMVSLQDVKQADMEFVKECLIQTMKDFGGV